MLKLSPAVTVKDLPGAFKGTRNTYTLFPDSEDKNVFYALAENPTFQPDSQGNPSFNLTWYFGSGPQPAAGICTMTVELPVPDINDAEVKGTILKALTTDRAAVSIATNIQKLCEAIDAHDAATVASLKKALGFDEAATVKKKALWNKGRDWTQFLPDHGLAVVPMPYKTGTVLVQAFSDKQAYDNKEAAQFTGRFETTPSLFNSNAAVVTFNLTDRGTNLFWHGMGGWPLDSSGARPAEYDAAHGGNSVISVIYQITFDGLLPEAKATVTLDNEVIGKLDIASEVRKGSWGRTYREEVPRGREYNEIINQSTQIVLPAVASKEDKDSVQKLLTDWAAKQLEEMAKSQLPSLNLGDLKVDGLRKLENIKKQVRTYTLTQAVTVPKYPQDSLPKIDGLVDAEGVKKSFQLINLNDVPYTKVYVTVAPPSLSYLKERQVDHFVVTQVSYAEQKLRDDKGQEVSSIEYPASAQQPANTTLTGTFGRDTQDKAIRYGYLVGYADGTPSLRVPTNSQTDPYLDFGGVDIGVLSVRLDAIDLPWDVVNTAKVDLQYAQWQRTITLKKDAGKVLISKPFGRKMDGLLSYTVTLNIDAGAPVVGDINQIALTRGHVDIALKNPLGNMTNPITFALGDGVTKAQLRVEYTFRSTDAQSQQPAPDRIFSRHVELDSSRDSGKLVWNVPRQSDTDSVLTVTKARVSTASGITDITNNGIGETVKVEQELSVTVEPDRLSFF